MGCAESRGAGMVVLGTSNELVLYAWVLRRCGTGFDGHPSFLWCLLKLSTVRAFIKTGPICSDELGSR